MTIPFLIQTPLPVIANASEAIQELPDENWIAASLRFS
jgi:hypothetical protein